MAYLRTLRRFGEARNQLLDRVAQADETSLRRRPAPDKWSALEIVEHLILAERHVFRFPEPSTLLQGKPQPRRPVRLALVWAVLKFGIPVRAPSRAMLPSGAVDLPELRARWDSQFEWLSRLPDHLTARDLDRPLFRHPVAGAISASQAIALNRVHLEHHLPQIRKLLGPL